MGVKIFASILRTSIKVTIKNKNIRPYFFLNPSVLLADICWLPWCSEGIKIRRENKPPQVVHAPVSKIPTSTPECSQAVSIKFSALCWRWIHTLSHVTFKEDQHHPPMSWNKRRSNASITHPAGKATQQRLLQALFSLRSNFSRPRCTSPQLRFQHPRPAPAQTGTRFQKTIYYP